jgi:hypothetical protein
MLSTMRVKVNSRMGLLAVCVDRRGYRVGARVAQFVYEWEMAVRSIKRPITAEEFAAWWKIGNATAYRRLVEFRDTFTELGERGFPHDLMRALLDRLAAGDDLGDEDVALAVPA